MRFAPTLLTTNKHRDLTYAQQWTRVTWVLGTMALICGIALVLAWKAYQSTADLEQHLKQSNALALNIEQVKTQTANLLYSQLRMVAEYRIHGDDALAKNSFSMQQLQGVTKALYLKIADINLSLSSVFWIYDTDVTQQADNKVQLQAAAGLVSQRLDDFKRLDQALIDYLRNKTLQNPVQRAQLEVQLQRTGDSLNDSAKSLGELADIQAQKVVRQANQKEDRLLLGIMAFSALAFLWNGGLLYFLSQSLKQNAALHRKLSDLASLDPLTGLLNRRALKQQFTIVKRNDSAQADKRAGPSDDTCLMLIDLDFFKQYNDTYGHVRGDAHLKDCAAIWRNGIRGNDVLARMGGEEFAILMPNCNESQAYVTAQRLQKAMPTGTAFSAGIALMRDNEAFEAWYERADAALYFAKEHGRARVQLAGDMPNVTLKTV